MIPFPYRPRTNHGHTTDKPRTLYGAPKGGAPAGSGCGPQRTTGRTTLLPRDTWKSDAIIQTDCCDSLQTVSAFGYEGLNKSAALALAVNDGLGVYGRAILAGL